MYIKIIIPLLLLLQINEIYVQDNQTIDFLIKCGMGYYCESCLPSEVVCSNLKFINFDAIKDATPEIESIVFTGNSLTTLNMPIFSKNMTQLIRLDLSNNNIESINGTAVFDNLPALTELILNNNKLSLIILETTKPFGFISDTLRILSLNNAFDFRQNQSTLDIGFHKLLNTSYFGELRTLKLENNSLTIFNNDRSFDYGMPKDTTYEDILCLLPKLEHLHLQNNKISLIDFKFSCIKENPLFNLISIHLESNLMNKFANKLIEKFRSMKVKNEKFRIYLANNPLKCNCALQDYQKWIYSNESDILIADKANIVCGNGSLSKLVNKRIVDLKDECPTDYQNQSRIEYTTKNKKFIFSPRFRNTTLPTPNYPKEQKESLHSTHKLILFMFVTSLISCLVIFIIKVHCCKIFRFSNLSWYKSIANKK